ncbi:MAG: hypothetical protein A2Z70_03125 [Chloroflexi bacterium RBG_13_48_17]|nr:MAG: hypothetical protein A2Z70_03125 [Chloroflexi bacterium RBG_13_48_17]
MVSIHKKVRDMVLLQVRPMTPEDAVRPVPVLGQMLLTYCGIIFAIPPIVFCIEYTINWSHE